AGGERGLRGPGRGGGVGVVAAADVLEVDKQQVETGERFRRRPERVLAVAVERADGDAGPGVALVLAGDHVLLDTVVAVLGAKENGGRAAGARRERHVGGAQVGSDGGVVREKAVAAAAQAIGGGEQAVKAGLDQGPLLAPRCHVPLRPPVLASSCRSVMTAPRSTALTMS